LLREAGKPVPYQHFYIIRPLAERRNITRGGREAEVKILAKLLSLDHPLERPVGGGDHANVDSPLAVFADPPHPAVIEVPQELHLHVQWNICDFIQKQRPMVRRLDEPRGVFQRSSKGSFPMTEELALE
jgi:hypothetical protein